MSNEREREIKIVELGHYPFLLELTGRGMAWQDEPATRKVIVVAYAGDVGDWAAYVDVPTGAALAGRGAKLPQDCGEALFPEWADRKWRR